MSICQLIRVGIGQLIFTRIEQIWNANPPIATSNEFLKIATNAPLRSFDIRIIAVVQDHQLNITKDRLERIIIGTTFWQGDPMQFQLPHQAAGLAGLARMR